MSWAAVAVGGATLVSGLVSGSKSGKAQKQQMAIEQEKIRFAKQRYNDADQLYGGLQQKVVDQAMEGVRPDLQGVSDRASADIATQYSGANESIMRNNMRMGINPNSGSYQTQLRSTALSEALAKAGGITRARETERNNAEQQTFSRRFQVGQMGINQMNGTASSVQDASSGLAASYGNQAAQLGQASSNAIGSGLSMIANSGLGKSNTGVTTTQNNYNPDPAGFNQPNLLSLS